MSNFIKNNKGELIEMPPYKCKVCGIGEIQDMHQICKTCGWEDDGLQIKNPDYIGGANEMSLNQYKEFWELNKDEITKSQDICKTAIILSKKYHKEHFSK